MATDEPKTVKVRIAVAVDEHGDWVAGGSSYAKGRQQEHMDSAKEYLHNNVREYWLTQELELPLPVPTATEVEATVEEQGNG